MYVSMEGYVGVSNSILLPTLTCITDVDLEYSVMQLNSYDV